MISGNTTGEMDMLRCEEGNIRSRVLDIVMLSMLKRTVLCGICLALAWFDIEMRVDKEMCIFILCNISKCT